MKRARSIRIFALVISCYTAGHWVGFDRGVRHGRIPYNR